MLIYKIDLISGTLCDGFINMGPHELYMLTCEYQKLHALNDGMYLFSLDTVVRISDFDFDQTENHTIDRIPLSGKISLGKRRRSDMTHFESCNGTGYCFLPPEVWHQDNWSILKLDVQKRSWVYIADSNCHYIFDLVPCNKTICMCGFASVNGRKYDGKTYPNDILFFDAVKEIVGEACIQLPVC